MTNQTHTQSTSIDSYDASPASPCTVADEMASAILRSREQMYAGRMALESALEDAKQTHAQAYLMAEDLAP